jgi:hypothetical protein
MRFSSSDKLRTLLGAKFGETNVFTQKFLAESLGISTRTLRRFKNQKGYRLAQRTETKIKASLDKENRNYRRFIRDKVLVPVVTRSRGRTRTEYVLKKIPRLRMPVLPNQPIPVLYKAKSGRSHTININCALWSTQQKIDYLLSAFNSRRFSAWTARIKVPVGVATSGDEESTEVNESERPMFYMIGPFTLDALTDRAGYGVRKKIDSEIVYHEDAGRIVVNISLVENLPEEEWKK